MRLIRKFGGGSGGGSNAQSVSTIPEWMKPYLETGLKTSQEALQSGALSQVAGQNDLQKQAQGAAQNVANLQGNVGLHSAKALDQLGKIAGGEEIVPSTTGATDAIKKAALYQAGAAGQGGIAANAARGTVGGSRQLIQAGASQNDQAAKLAGIDYQDLQSRRQLAQSAAGQAVGAGRDVQEQLITGVNTLKGVGSDIQGQAQREADAGFQGLSRYSSLIQGTPWQSQQQKQQGGK